MSIRTLQRINLGLFVLTPILNIGSAFVQPVESRGTIDIDTLLDPAGYAFSIWGVIFLGMIWHSWRQLQRPLPTDSVQQRLLRRATIGLMLAAIATILFVPITFIDIPLTGLADILLHFIPLVIGYAALRALPDRPFWRFHWPVSVFLGWICLALVVTTTKTLADLGWRPDVSTAQWLALVVLTVVVGLGTYFVSRFNDYFLVLTLSWGMIGIYVDQLRALNLASMTALAGAIMLIVLSGWYRWLQKPNVVI